MCIASATGFALVTVSEHSVAYFVPRARLMHRRSAGGEVAWPHILARANCCFLQLLERRNTLNDAAPRKYSAYRTETKSYGEQLAKDISFPLNRAVRIVKLLTTMN